MAVVSSGFWSFKCRLQYLPVQKRKTCETERSVCGHNFSRKIVEDFVERVDALVQSYRQAFEDKDKDFDGR